MKIRLDAAVRNLSDKRDTIDAFDRKCEAEEHTDTGEAWELLWGLRLAITNLLESWDNDK